jgi:23S rRNA (adenine2503-C2)-methyltransferase
MSAQKINIRNLTIGELENLILDSGEKKFRAKQITDWIWNKGVTSFEAMKNIPKSTRNYMEEKTFIDSIDIAQEFLSLDKTRKILFQSQDKHLFEGVLIFDAGRTTACVSTQIGCPLACTFCASGFSGFVRNLNPGEIFDQIVFLNNLSLKQSEKKLSNIVVMGMGEPLLNYENTLSFINHITADYSFGFSPKRITLSTAGIAPAIILLADHNIRFNLAISLHTTINSKRDIIMPINKKYNIDKLKEAIKYFYNKTGQRITYEYLLLKDFNDSLDDAKSLTEFTKISPCKINIINYNNTACDTFLQSGFAQTEAFAQFLMSKNLVVNIRKSKGEDINAACGQLVKKNKEF